MMALCILLNFHHYNEYTIYKSTYLSFKYEKNPYVHRMHYKGIEKHSGPIKSKD